MTKDIQKLLGTRDKKTEGQILYDLAIIGAGPAGSSLARILAQKQPALKILLLDGQKEGRGKPCGGLLSPDAQKALKRQGLDLPVSVLVEPTISGIRTLDLVSGLSRFYRRNYLNMDRSAFEDWLLSLALAFDQVEYVRSGCRHIKSLGDKYELKVANQATYYAKNLVGADGAASLVRRTFLPKNIPDRYVAIQEWYWAKQSRRPMFYCLFDQETSPSCSWLFQKQNQLAYGGAFQGQGCRKAFARQKAKFSKAEGYDLTQPLRLEACLVVNPRHWSDFAFGLTGVYLIGEAAGMISASSYEGFSYALESADLLARAFDPTDPQKTLALYRRSSLPLRLKLWSKIVKKNIIFKPSLRSFIMRLGLGSSGERINEFR